MDEQYQNPYLSQEQREHRQYYFWAELCFFPLGDEFDGKVPKEISAFIKQATEQLNELGIEIQSRKDDSQKIIIEIGSKSDSDASRNALQELLNKLHNHYLFYLQNVHFDERTKYEWGDDFILTLPSQDASTSVGRRTIVQEAMTSRRRLKAQIKTNENLLETLDSNAPNIPKEIIDLQKSEISAQIEMIRQQMKKVEVDIEGVLNIMHIADASDFTQVPTGSVVVKNKKLSESQKNIEWRDAKEPETLEPAVCMTVGDIVDHPILQAALRRVVKHPDKSYEEVLLNALEDPEKTDDLFKESQRVLRHISKKAQLTPKQLQSGLAGFLQLVLLAKKYKATNIPKAVRKDKLSLQSFKDQEIPLDISETFLAFLSHLDLEKTVNEQNIQEVLQFEPMPEMIFPGKRIGKCVVQSYQKITDGIYEFTFVGGGAKTMKFSDESKQYELFAINTGSDEESGYVTNCFVSEGGNWYLQAEDDKWYKEKEGHDQMETVQDLIFFEGKELINLGQKTSRIFDASIDELRISGSGNFITALVRGKEVYVNARLKDIKIDEVRIDAPNKCVKINGRFLRGVTLQSCHSLTIDERIEQEFLIDGKTTTGCKSPFKLVGHTLFRASLEDAGGIIIDADTFQPIKVLGKYVKNHDDPFTVQTNEGEIEVVSLTLVTNEEIIVKTDDFMPIIVNSREVYKITESNFIIHNQSIVEVVYFNHEYPNASSQKAVINKADLMPVQILGLDVVSIDRMVFGRQKITELFVVYAVELSNNKYVLATNDFTTLLKTEEGIIEFDFLKSSHARLFQKDSTGFTLGCNKGGPFLIEHVIGRFRRNRRHAIGYQTITSHNSLDSTED